MPKVNLYLNEDNEIIMEIPVEGEQNLVGVLTGEMAWNLGSNLRDAALKAGYRVKRGE